LILLIRPKSIPEIFRWVVAAILLISMRCSAQELPVSRSMQKAYANGTRDKTGSPGKSYWQNSCDYNIKVVLTPSIRELSGTVGIDYTNNSTDTLSSVVFKLYPNLYKAGAMRNMPIAQKDLHNGVRIKSLIINNRSFDSSERIMKGTNMYIKGTQILPGQRIHADISYSYSINKGSFIRTGQIDSGAFVIAYFFPRVSVYDDIDGWNEYPYLGKEEFYNDYGDFHAEINVPGDYQVWATGELKNMDEVYEPEIRKRIEVAQRSDSVTDIITVNDLKKRNVTKKDLLHTWIFEATHVTDFAFAVSNHYVWKASSVMVEPFTKRRTRVDAVFNPDHTAYLPVAGYARKTVELISYFFPKIPFPYSHETLFEGLDAMEYPMMVNNLPFDEPKDAIEFTAHEVVHSLFPFYVANNETKYSFMDEGWATLTELMFHPLIDSTIPVKYDISSVNESAGTDEDMPVTTPTPQLYGKARFADKDLKPALAYLYLKEMLGDSLFIKAVQFYIAKWAGKHPTPFDFFYSMNVGSGLNLTWFWKNWFFEKNVPDLAISSATHKLFDYTVVISRLGTLAVPIHLTIVCEDGSKQTITKNISCWATGKKQVILKFKAKMKVRQLILGNEYDVDINPENNNWTMPVKGMGNKK
jgi:hypothetical protein